MASCKSLFVISLVQLGWGWGGDNKEEGTSEARVGGEKKGSECTGGSGHLLLRVFSATC